MGRLLLLGSAVRHAPIVEEAVAGRHQVVPVPEWPASVTADPEASRALAFGSTIGVISFEAGLEGDEELLREVLALEPALPVLLVTDAGRASDARRYLGWQPLEVVTVPGEISQLSEAIERLFIPHLSVDRFLPHLASSLAHQINSPLVSVRTLARLAQGPARTALRQIARSVLVSMDRMDRAIRVLVAFAELPPPNPRPVPVGPLLTQIEIRIREVLNEGGIVERSAPPDLPIVLVDPPALGFAAAALAAADDPLRGKRTVRLAAEASPSGVLVTVTGSHGLGPEGVGQTAILLARRAVERAGMKPTVDADPHVRLTVELPATDRLPDPRDRRQNVIPIAFRERRRGERRRVIRGFSPDRRRPGGRAEGEQSA